MKQLDYFPFYYSYVDRFSTLSDAQLGRAVRAACMHGMGQEPEEKNRAVLIALKTMIFDLDRAKANYAELIRCRQEAGRRGAEKRWGLQEDPGARDTGSEDGIPMAEDGRPMAGYGKHGESESKSKSESNSESDAHPGDRGRAERERADPSVFFSLAGADGELRQRMEEYLGLLTERGRKLTPETLRALSRKLTSFPRENWTEVVDQSLRNGWTDLYALPASGHGARSSDCMKHGAPMSPLMQQAVRKVLAEEVDN